LFKNVCKYTQFGARNSYWRYLGEKLKFRKPVSSSGGNLRLSVT